MTPHPQGIIIAIVGMPGSGKSEAVAYLQKKGIPFIRFGDLTDQTIREMGLPPNHESERIVREKLRQEHGMDVYAVKAEQKIHSMLEKHTLIAIDGLYSWEEYVFLKKRFPQLTLIHVYSEPEKRYKRLANRTTRAISAEHARARDISEIEKLNKGGPIAMADYIIENNTDDVTELYEKIDGLLSRIGLKFYD